MRVAVFGASGFVGATLVERLRRRRDLEVRALIHSAGNAWRLARWGMPLGFTDLLSRGSIAEALKGCTHVVNCTRGSEDVMLIGLKNLLSEARAQKIQRFIHLSSVAVYGDPPRPESENEDAEPHPARGSYGEIKLKQDTLISHAHRNGLNCIVLCPPNISGAYSSFVCNVLQDIRIGSFALIEGGRSPLNIVDVANLCHAIELALVAESADGRRIFVTDGDHITWRDFAEALGPLAERTLPLAELPRDRVGQPPQANSPRSSSFARAIKHLVSSDVRQALRQDPLLAKVEASARKLVTCLPRGVEERIRDAVVGPIKIAKRGEPDPHSSRYNTQQLRVVVHRTGRAKTVLGYQPEISFLESMEAFRRWYTMSHGFGTEGWRLSRWL